MTAGLAAACVAAFAVFVVIPSSVDGVAPPPGVEAVWAMGGLTVLSGAGARRAGVRFLDDDSALHLSVRPGTDAAVRHPVEEWAASEVVRLAMHPHGACEWKEHVLAEGCR